MSKFHKSLQLKRSSKRSSKFQEFKKLKRLFTFQLKSLRLSITLLKKSLKFNLGLKRSLKFPELLKESSKESSKFQRLSKLKESLKKLLRTLKSSPLKSQFTTSSLNQKKLLSIETELSQLKKLSKRLLKFQFTLKRLSKKSLKFQR